MPTNPNMVAIQTVTVGAGGAASISFSNIPQTYTDLVIQVSLRSTNASSTMSEYYGVYFNGSTSNLSYRRLYGNAGGAGSDNGTIVLVGSLPAAGFTANTFGSGQIYIPNYTSSNNKSFSTDNVAENNSSAEWETNITASLWSNTAAITSITIVPRRDNFAQYSTATLYGVTSAGYGAKATGGAIYQDANYFYHVFSSSGTFTPTQSITADCLVIAGGGGGGGTHGGGGGAGGLAYYSAQSLTAQNYTITVGGGGSAGADKARGTNGSNSQFGSLTASTGGGAGGGGYSSGDTQLNGNNGGSGGGGGGGSGAGTGGTATSGQGSAGGTGVTSDGGGGGGGGAGAAGANGQVSVTGNGAAGGNGSSTYSSWGSATSTGQNISGTYWYAGGGGGGIGWPNTIGAGGNGGGGSGGRGQGTGNIDPTAGTANTGGGGGGGRGSNPTPGAAGGSGIVIVRYAK